MLSALRACQANTHNLFIDVQLCWPLVSVLEKVVASQYAHALAFST